MNICPFQQAVIDAFKDSGLSMRELSRETGVPWQTIQQVMNGTSVPKVNTLEPIANGLGLYFVLVKRKGKKKIS